MKLINFVNVFLVSIVMAGCSASGMKDVQPSGFLDNYSMLQPGGEDRAALYYINPTVDFKPYTKIMFDRIVVTLSDNAKSTQVDPTQLMELVDYYQTALIDAVKSGYEIVDTAGPDVLRVKVAITGVKPSKPVANTLSTILPVGWAVSGAVKVASDDNMGTGEAASEMNLTDSVTGESLAAAVDRRQGGKGAFRGEWEDTKDAFDVWAKRFRERLDEARGI